MRFFLVGLSTLAIGCTADTFVGADGSTGGDGGNGDGATVDAPFDIASCVPTWCVSNPAQQNAFCTDFDEASSIPGDWQQDTTSGTVTLVTSPAEQCLSLHSHLGVVSNPPGAARISHTMLVNGITAPHATLALDVFLPKTTAGGTVFFFAIRTSSLSVGLVQRQDGSWWLQSSLGTTSLTAPLASQGPVLMAFTHMVLDVTYQTNQVSATLTYHRSDGNLDTIDANSTAITVGSSLSFLVGMNASAQTSSELDAYYDDVVTTLQ